MDNIENYLTVKEAALILNVSEYTVRNYIKNNILDAKKIHKGKSYYYVISNSILQAYKLNEGETTVFL